MKINLNNVYYKPLQKDSISTLLEMQEEAFDHANGNSDFLRRNTYETLEVCFYHPSLVLGAFYEEKMIAFGILYVAGNTKENLALDLDECEDVTKNANVKLTIVRPDFRGNGLQAELITKLEEHAKKEGFTWLTSTVSPANPWSMHNLLKCGFTQSKVLEKYGGLKRMLFSKKI